VVRVGECGVRFLTQYEPAQPFPFRISLRSSTRDRSLFERSVRSGFEVPLVALGSQGSATETNRDRLSCGDLRGSDVTTSHVNPKRDRPGGAFPEIVPRRTFLQVAPFKNDLFPPRAYHIHPGPNALGDLEHGLNERPEKGPDNSSAASLDPGLLRPRSGL